MIKGAMTEERTENIGEDGGGGGGGEQEGKVEK